MTDVSPNTKTEAADGSQDGLPMLSPGRGDSGEQTMERNLESDNTGDRPSSESSGDSQHESLHISAAISAIAADEPLDEEVAIESREAQYDANASHTPPAPDVDDHDESEPVNESACSSYSALRCIASSGEKGARESSIDSLSSPQKASVALHDECGIAVDSDGVSKSGSFAFFV